MWNCKQDDRGWSVRSVPLLRPNVTLVGERREVKVHDGVCSGVTARVVVEFVPLVLSPWNVCRGTSRCLWWNRIVATSREAAIDYWRHDR